MRVLHDDAICFTVLRWTPSLPHRSKLKGECKDVKSGCGTSVGPSLNPPQSELKQNSRDTVPLTSLLTPVNFKPVPTPAGLHIGRG